MRRTTVVAAVGVAALATALVAGPARAADPAPPAGMVRATNDGGLVLMYDTTTGQRNGRYTMPFTLSDWAPFQNNQVAFSPDRRYAAAVVDAGVQVAKFDGTAYRTVHTYTEAELPADPAVRGRLTDLHFIADGRLMFVAQGDPDEEDNLVKAAYAVDPKQPTVKPVPQPYTSTAWDSKGRHTTSDSQQVDGLSVTVVRSSAELVGARIGGAGHYSCTEPLDATRLLCLAPASEPTPAQGVVAVLTLLPTGGYTLTRQIATLPAHGTPAEPETRNDLYVSADRTRLLIVTPQGWYAAAVGGTSAAYQYPHLGAVPVAASEDLIGWGPNHYTAYSYSYP